jgi:hypothetical protein
MGDNTRFKLEIYCEGVVTDVRVRGTKRFLAERDFLDWIIGHPRPEHIAPRPLPDDNREHYSLNREQIAIYAEFRRNLAHTSD